MYTEYRNNSQYIEIILPIMPALCLMLSGTYHAQNYILYASIIGWCLIIGNFKSIIGARL